jgi:DNA-binding CsgD family transcriptional regulator
MYAAAAHDAYTRLKGLREANDIARAVATESAKLGMSRVMVIDTVNADRGKRWIGSVGCDFARDYFVSTLALKDALARPLVCATAPFQWSDALWFAEDYDGCKTFPDQLRGAHVAAGFVVPMFGPSGLRGYINYVSDRPLTLSLEQTVTLRMLAIEAFDRSTGGAAPPPAPQLTPRQRECLALASEGATSARIAERLGITTRTVEAYMYDTMRRLGASTKTQAIAIAMRHGVIK